MFFRLWCEKKKILSSNNKYFISTERLNIETNSNRDKIQIIEFYNYAPDDHLRKLLTHINFSNISGLILHVDNIHSRIIHIFNVYNID